MYIKRTVVTANTSIQFQPFDWTFVCRAYANFIADIFHSGNGILRFSHSYIFEYTSACAFFAFDCVQSARDFSVSFSLNILRDIFSQTFHCSPRDYSSLFKANLLLKQPVKKRLTVNADRFVKKSVSKRFERFYWNKSILVILRTIVFYISEERHLKKMKIFAVLFAIAMITISLFATVFGVPVSRSESVSFFCFSFVDCTLLWSKGDQSSTK